MTKTLRRTVCLAGLACALGGTAAPARPTAQEPATPAMDESGFVAVGADTIFYETMGRGPALVLIHDGLVHRQVWDAQMAFFAREHRVIRYDRRGYGRSPAATERWANVDDLHLLLAHLKVESACLAGMSSGGGLALEFALRYPEKVSALVLVGAVVPGFPFTQHFTTRGGHLPLNPTPAQSLAYYASTDPYEVYNANTAARALVADLLHRNPPARGGPAPLPPPPGPTALQRLAEIKVPALILVGEFDIPDVHAHAGAISGGIANSRRDVIPKAGHLVPLEQPELFNNAVDSFLMNGARLLESLVATRGSGAAVGEHRKTVAGSGRYRLVEAELNALGYRYLRAERVKEAIAAFQVNTEAFPQSWNVWDSLGEAYREGGDRASSDRCYTRSLELNPANAGAKAILAETRETLHFAPGEQTRLQGPYLGQKPPGTTPVVFAPGLVSSYGHFDFAITFTPDGREMYFTRRKDGDANTIMVSRLESDGWTAPAEAAFSRGFASNEPHVTPDGRRLFFGSMRPRPGETRPTYGIWVVERGPNGTWGSPAYHGPGMYVSVANSGNLYLTDITMAAGGGLVVSPWTDGKHGLPRRLGGGVNTPGYTAHGFIAPDESYVIFDATRPGGQGGEGDFYVCFRKADGSWSDAINLGDAVNTPGLNFCPFVSRDGKYLFYTMNRDIYWVGTGMLDGLKAKALAPGKSER